MTTIAVTGATGFIGRHLVPHLRERPYQVRALVRNGGATRLPADVGVITGDLTDPNAADRLVRGTGAVIHLGGVAHTTISTPAEKQRLHAINVGGTKNVLEAARRNGVRRVVIASSAHVYAGQNGTNIAEHAPLAGENVYAQTKIEVEGMARRYCSNDMHVVIGRPCLTYGAGAAFNLARLLRALDRGFYFHAGDMPVERSVCSVHSAAAAFAFLMENGTPGETYNIADRVPVLLEEFVNDLARRMGRRAPWRVPLAVLRPVAAGFSVAKRVGFPAPIDSDSLSKLTDSFSISTDKIAALGFTWPDAGDRARQEMVHAYIQKRTA